MKVQYTSLQYHYHRYHHTTHKLCQFSEVYDICDCEKYHFQQRRCKGPLIIIFKATITRFASIWHMIAKSTISNNAGVKALVELLNPLYAVRVRVPSGSCILKLKNIL